MAPLELVMSLPFVLGVAAMMLSLGFVTLDRYGAAIDARNLAWKMRSDPNTKPVGVIESSYEKSTALSAFSDNALDGEIFVKTRREVKLFPWLGSVAYPESGTAVLTDPWDYRSVPDFDKTGPHINVLARMVGQDIGPVQDMMGLLAMSVLTLPNSDEIEKAEEGKKEAEEQAEKYKKEMEKQLERLRDQLEELRTQRDELQSEQDKLKADRDKLNEEIRELEKLQPPPPQLAEKIAERNRLNGNISDLQRKIDQKQREMDAKEAEIRQMEKAIRQAEDEANKL